jgi:hypothetical protein
MRRGLQALARSAAYRQHDLDKADAARQIGIVRGTCMREVTSLKRGPPWMTRGRTIHA